jgi:transcriptional regulator with XRE-family HTH domain
VKGRSVLGVRLREARLRAGISQKTLGIRAGIDEFSSSPRINQYERGVHVPNFQTVERLAKVLGVPTSFFYARDDEFAELILMIGLLTGGERKALMSRLRRRTHRGNKA